MKSQLGGYFCPSAVYTRIRLIFKKNNAHQFDESPNRKHSNEIAIGGLFLSISVPEDQEESRLIGLEVLMAPLGRPRFAVLYLRGPINNPRILEQRYDTFFVMMLFYVDLSPKKLCSKHCFRRSARLGSLFSSPKLPIPLCLRFSICTTMTIFLSKYLIHNDFVINDILTK